MGDQLRRRRLHGACPRLGQERAAHSYRNHPRFESDGGCRVGARRRAGLGPPKGAFLARTARAVAKTNAASLAECTFAAADWVSLGAPTTAYSGTAKWIPSLQLGMLAENGTCSARRIGWLMYAAQGHGPPGASGDGGPLHLVLKRVKGQLVDAQVGDDLEDVAVAAAGVICGREMPRQLAVYRPAGPLHLHSVYLHARLQLNSNPVITSLP